MKDYLFDREINALFYAKDRTIGTEVGNDFHIRFLLDRSFKGDTPNAGSMVVYNLSKSTRDFIANDATNVLINVGYAGNDLGQLTVSDIDWAHSYKDGVDWITEVFFTEDGKDIRNTYMTKAYQNAVPDKRILDDIVGEMKGVVTGTIKSFKNAINKNGASFSSIAKDGLNALMGKQESEWTIQQGKLHVLGDVDLITDEFIELSSESGLLGTPKKTRKEDEKGKITYMLSFTSLILPELSPGRGVRVVSLTNTGTYKLYTCSFSGSNYDANWSCSMEGVQI